MKKNFTLTATCLLALSNVLSQDTLKIGINSDLINVTPPAMNHKVDVLIEDSTFNYHVIILKTDKNMALNSGKNATGEKPVVKNKFSSSLMNEIELGASFIPTYTSKVINSYGSRSDRNHVTEKFMSNGQTLGFYASINLYSKSRLFTPSQKFYFRNNTQLKYNQNTYSGQMEYKEIFATTPSRPYDSIGRIDVFRSNVTLANVFLVKRLALGYIVHQKSNFSLEYGLDIGLRLSTKFTPLVYNTGAAFNDRMYYAKVLSSPFISNPTFILYQRLGINYRRFTANVGYSIPKVKMGSNFDKSGRMMNIGLAFRFR